MLAHSKFTMFQIEHFLWADTKTTTPYGPMKSWQGPRSGDSHPEGALRGRRGRSTMPAKRTSPRTGGSSGASASPEKKKKPRQEGDADDTEAVAAAEAALAANGEVTTRSGRSKTTAAAAQPGGSGDDAAHP